MEIAIAWRMSAVKSYFHNSRNWRGPAHQVRCGPARRSATSEAAKNQRMTPSPVDAPASCATMNMGTSAGAIPEKLRVSARAIGTAGLDKDRDALDNAALA